MLGDVAHHFDEFGADGNDDGVFDASQDEEPRERDDGVEGNGDERKAFFDGLEAEAADKLSDGERLQKLAKQFSLTPREAEVFGLLVNTEDGLQTIADNLYVSRRTLERYVSAIYEKTGARSRIGLVTLYNNA